MSDDTIFSEINEELRRDRVRSGWRRYGVYVIGAAVLLVVAVAGYEGWSWWRASSAMHSSDQLFAALKLSDDGKIADARTALEKLAATGSGDYPTLAKFKQAALLARAGKTAEAQAAYDALATAQGDPQMRSLALLYAANLLVDKGDVAGVKSRVEGLLAPNNPLRGAAEEAIGLAQYKSGDLAGARASFTNVLNDPAASQQTRQRVEIYLAQLTAQGAGATAEPAAKPGTSPAAKSSTAPAASSPATPAATTAPAAAKSPPAASTEPAGVESNQPMLPDAALQLATPAPPAAPQAPADTTAPTLSTGAGLPTGPDNAATPMPTPAAGATTQPPGTATPSDNTGSAPAATTPAASRPAEAPAAAAPAAPGSGTLPVAN